MSSSDELLRLVLIVILAVLAIPLLMMFVAAPMVGGMHTGSSPGPWGWLWMALPVLLLLLVLGYGAARLLQGGEDDAVAELRRAYARGELSDEEYESRRQRLEADREP